MIVNLDNLQAGLKWWRKSDWPKDIHNTAYYDIYGIRAKGPTEIWWDNTVNRLSQWHAYRGPNPPNTKDAITKRGKRYLAILQLQYTKILSKNDTEPSIADLSWENITDMFAIISKIKPNSSVFAGKMCHFLFPKLFIVMDNFATNVFDYEFYWRGMKEEWKRLKDKGAARNILANAIHSNKPLHPLYPFETKIIELSHIGYKHG